MVHHLKDGEDFGPSHFSKDFGFHGSSSGVGPGKHHSKATHLPERQSPSDLSAKHVSPGDNTYRKGGEVGHAHPHGHHVVEVEHHEDGSVTHHHAHGGMTHHHADGHISHHHAHGGEISAHEGHQGHHGGHSSVHAHPHGHHVTHVESLHDGSEVHHHSHGGYTIHHAHGGVSHHGAHGETAGNGQAGHARHTEAEYMPKGKNGGFEDEDQYTEYEAHEAKLRKGGQPKHGKHPFQTEEAYDDGEEHEAMSGKGSYARGGHAGHPDYAEDKAMIEKGFRQHDEHMHGGKHEQIHLARGGLPPALRAGKPPIGQAPRPSRQVTPRQAVPLGGAPMGVEPSAEPNAAGSEQGIPQLRKGGQAHHKKHHRY